jgi:hypothetical protein
MKRLSALGRIRTHRNIRTRYSILASTGPGRARWPRLKEAEQLQAEEKHVKSGRRRIWRW